MIPFDNESRLWYNNDMMSENKHVTLSVVFDPESLADLNQLVKAAERAADSTKIKGTGKATGFRSAIVRECIKRSRKSVLDDLQAEGIRILL